MTTKVTFKVEVPPPPSLPPNKKIKCLYLRLVTNPTSASSSSLDLPQTICHLSEAISLSFSATAPGIASHTIALSSGTTITYQYGASVTTSGASAGQPRHIDINGEAGGEAGRKGQRQGQPLPTVVQAKTLQSNDNSCSVGGGEGVEVVWERDTRSIVPLGLSFFVLDSAPRLRHPSAASSTDDYGTPSSSLSLELDPSRLTRRPDRGTRAQGFQRTGASFLDQTCQWRFELGPQTLHESNRALGTTNVAAVDFRYPSDDLTLPPLARQLPIVSVSMAAWRSPTHAVVLTPDPEDGTCTLHLDKPSNPYDILDFAYQCAPTTAPLVYFDLYVWSGSQPHILAHDSEAFVGRAAFQGEQLTEETTNLFTLPIFNRGLGVVGSLNLRVTRIRPFAHPLLSRVTARTYSKESDTVDIGHRGFGANGAVSGDPSAKRRTRVAENTILSFVTAARVMNHVEFDVQMTKDGIPVIWHDFVLGSSGKTVFSVTLEEMRSIVGTRHTDVAVGDTVPTLADVLTKTPVTLGCDVELKWPSVFSRHVFPDMNMFLDEVLRVVFDHAAGTDRPIFFSCFDPMVCLMLSLKQPRYPVFFLTEGGKEELIDPVRNSLAAAVHFAERFNLLGVVTRATPLATSPALISFIKARYPHVLLATYGAENNDEDFVKLQEELGVDAVISDHRVLDNMRDKRMVAQNEQQF
eukprot:CAMPEP_0170756192 /NCGR_PEP_ID=MMETSP0437-20130122/13901_1 /TAXON_ID=0 /ORGANISM="Sexangularia sp." /LENGTH=691 /DNA_ID=CAMNT_0011095373 /DNA_START=35 /DNA_END=2110 /DNA_ORIENTATION=-